MLTADSGTVAQPLKLDELAPTVKVHVCPFFPWVIFQATVATEPPAMVLPGLFAVNGIVLGVARSRLITLNPVGLGGQDVLPDEKSGGGGVQNGLANGKTGADWRGLTIGF